MVLRDSRGLRAPLVGLLLALFALVGTSAAEETVPDLFKEASASAMREAIEQHPFEQIEPYSDALLLSVTDVP